MAAILGKRYFNEHFPINYTFWDDFESLDSTLWTTVGTGGSSVTALDPAPGGLFLWDTGAANTGNEVYMYSRRLFEPGQVPFQIQNVGMTLQPVALVGSTFEFMVWIPEANVNQANVVFAVTPQTPATGFIAGAAGGLQNPFIGAAIYKNAGENQWRGIVSDGTSTQRTAIQSQNPEIVAGWNVLTIEIEPVGAPQGSVAQAWGIRMLTNKVILLQPSSVVSTPTAISAYLTNPTVTPYRMVAGVRNGSPARETLTGQYMTAGEYRVNSIT